MSYVAEKISGTKYLSTQTALEQSELSKEELERAMALGFVSVIEVGTTRFIERSSLNRFVAIQEEKEAKFSPFVKPSVEVPQKPDNAIFSEALSRELAIEKRRSLVPAVIALALALVALMLAMPLPRDVERTRAAAVEAVAPVEARIMIKEALGNIFNAITGGQNHR